MKPFLFLFDIDGTLISTGGAGEKALRLATYAYFETNDDLAGIEIAGRTDTGIARRILERFGRDPNDEAACTAFLGIYLDHLKAMLPTVSGRILPGMRELLEAALAAPGVEVGLLTGNIRAGAEAKLTHYGLWHHFSFGAFADDHHERNALGPVALARAEQRTGRSWTGDQVWILGDTPHDIACARAIGARTVAVATGIFSEAVLRETAHADDLVVADAKDHPVLLKAMLGSTD